jgi:multidrug efflux pump subunit AcrB
MNLVQAALRRPLTILVLVIAVSLGAGVSLKRMSRDIFPPLGIPTIYVAQPFGGMDPAQMEGYLTYYYEYHFLYITGIEHVESKSIQGASLMKLQFHPGTDMSQALSEVISYVNRARAFMPPGTVPPFIMRFDAGSVPVGYLVFSSETRSVGQMQDAALNLVRPLFATLPGVSAPPPFGGSARTILVNVKPDRLRACNLTPDDIVQAMSQANAISPSGNMNLGELYPIVPVNSVVRNIKDLEGVALRTSGSEAIYLRDIATVEDGSDLVTSYALVNGRRTVYIPVTKRADASTLSVVNLVKQNLQQFQSVLPDDVKVSYEFDQSPVVLRAISDLGREGALGAVLTGLMVLLFLRDWRTALIVVINIPLALLASTFALWLCGQNINLMTLGGLALAVGILVDEATVTIENIHAHLARGAPLARAARQATLETALPRLLAMLCVVAVFIPAFFMTGAARALFVPLSLAVGFSMLASYLLSSTLVPVLSIWLLRAHAAAEPAGGTRAGLFLRLQTLYGRWATGAVRFRWLLLAVYLIGAGAILVVAANQHLGIEIFPRVDTGQLALRLRAPAGTKVEATEQLALRALELVQREAGSNEVAITLGLVGVHAPNYPINLIHLWNAGPEEAWLAIQLKPGGHIGIAALEERLRAVFETELPGVRCSFEPSDIVNRVMSFGSATPIEVAVSGPNLAANREHAQKLFDQLKQIPALRDVQFVQTLDFPTVDVKIDRERAGLLGVKVADVSRSLVAATTSSRFTVANFWADANSGVSYNLQVQIPQAQTTTLEDLKNVPVNAAGGRAMLLRNVADVTPGTAVGQYERYNMARVVSITANIEGSDLGRVTRQIGAAIARAGAAPARTSVNLRGQAVPLQELLHGFQNGLFTAIIVIFLMLAANFQSVRLSLAVLSTLPAVLAGIVLTLWLTGSTLNIQSAIGSIMAVGVAVANAILLVTFAERNRMAGATARDAAVEGARSRLRPILMTSLAMIAGMFPMALGLGGASGQTAPLARAVIGGLAFATLATLFVLPSAFAFLQGSAHRRSPSLDPDEIAGLTPGNIISTH